MELSDARERVAALFAALQPLPPRPPPPPEPPPAPKPPRKPEAALKPGEIRVITRDDIVSSGIASGGVDGVEYEARVQFWCGEDAHGPFMVTGYPDTEAPAERVSAWAQSLFARHKDSPVVEDSESEQKRTGMKWSTITDGTYRIRHDPVGYWDDE